LASLSDAQQGHIDLLRELRDSGMNLVAEKGAERDSVLEFQAVLEEQGQEGIFADIDRYEGAADRAIREMNRTWRSLANPSAECPPFSPRLERKLAMKQLLRALWFKEAQPDGVEMLTMADVRREQEAALVAIETYLDGGNFRKALYDPDTSGRHCSASTLNARLERIEGAFMGMMDAMAEEVNA
jgi:hypothetical protein